MDTMMRAGWLALAIGAAVASGAGACSSTTVVQGKSDAAAGTTGAGGAASGGTSGSGGGSSGSGGASGSGGVSGSSGAAGIDGGAGAGDGAFDPCAGITCDSPPPDTCSDATHISVPDVPGSCAASFCVFSTHTVTCTDQACVNGTCVGVCSPGATRCTIGTPETCDTCGQWQTSGSIQTDPLNCGSCGHDCLGGACTGGACQPVLIGTGHNPWGIAIDATTMYVTDPGTHTLDKLPLGGGTLTTLGTYTSGPIGIGVNSTDIFYIADDTAFRMPLTGGPATTVASAPSSAGLAITSSDIFWATTGAIMRMPIGGGSSNTFASGQVGPEGVSADGSNVYWANSGSNPNTGGVMKLGVGGGTPTALISGSNGWYEVAADSTYVYATNLNAGTIVKVPIAGGSSTVVVSGQTLVQGIAVDANAIYWTTSTNKIMRLAK